MTAPASGARRRLRRAAVAALALLAAAACADSADPGPRACTEEARPSVTVFVVDERGVPLPGATVTWRVDGGEVAAAECADPLRTPATCTTFTAGWERAGLFDVAAAKAGRVPAGAALRVEMDAVGCHVVTQPVTLPLPPR